MKRLKKSVDEYIRIGRKYFKASDNDYLYKLLEAEDRMNELNKKVGTLVNNANFMIVDSIYSYAKIYEVIKLLTDVDLLEEEE